MDLLVIFIFIFSVKGNYLQSNLNNSARGMVIILVIY